MEAVIVKQLKPLDSVIPELCGLLKTHRNLQRGDSLRQRLLSRSEFTLVDADIR
jgi:hypothetical protein